MEDPLPHARVSVHRSPRSAPPLCILAKRHKKATCLIGFFSVVYLSVFIFSNVLLVSNLDNDKPVLKQYFPREHYFEQNAALKEGGRRHPMFFGRKPRGKTKEVKPERQLILILASEANVEAARELGKFIQHVPNVFIWPRPIDPDGDSSSSLVARLFQCKPKLGDYAKGLAECTGQLKDIDMIQKGDNCRLASEGELLDLCEEHLHVALTAIVTEAIDLENRDTTYNNLQAFPNLHILQLTQDPRTNLASLITTDRMESIEIGLRSVIVGCRTTSAVMHYFTQNATSSYNFRYNVFRVEDLTRKPVSGSLDVLNAMNVALPSDVEVEGWLRTTMNETFGRFDPVSPINRLWPALDFSTVQRVQEGCQEYMLRAGYRKVSDYSQLADKRDKLMTQFAPNPFEIEAEILKLGVTKEPELPEAAED